MPLISTIRLGSFGSSLMVSVSRFARNSDHSHKVFYEPSRMPRANEGSREAPTIYGTITTASDHTRSESSVSSERSESRGKPDMSKYYFYIARCKDNSLYIGVTNNNRERIRRHNKGQGALWIKKHGQAKIVYTEKYDIYLAAHRRELQVKKWSRKKKENLIRYGHPTKLNF